MHRRTFLERSVALAATAAVPTTVLAGFTSAAAAPDRAPFGRSAHLVGSLHEHTAYSDGQIGSRPADAFAAARANGRDWCICTDHSDTFLVPLSVNGDCTTPASLASCVIADDTNPADSLRKWQATRDQADAATRDGFVAARGFEWTSDRFGHLTVLFGARQTGAKTDGGYVAMETFWSWFARSERLGGGADALMTFCHPGDKQLSASDPGRNWNDFAYVPGADDRVVGIELYNSKDYEAGEGHYYSRALDKGWHVGAVAAEDSHYGGWGDADRPKTVALTGDRSVTGLRAAMLARRTYALRTADAGPLSLVADGRHAMGSRVLGRPHRTVRLEAAAGPAARRLEIVTNSRAVVAASRDGGRRVAVDVPVTADERWYFVQALGADGAPVAYSSPIWIRGATAAEPAATPAPGLRRRRSSARFVASPMIMDPGAAGLCTRCAPPMGA